MNILLIEDDLEVSAYVAEGLKQAGHSVSRVSDGDAALIEASHGEFDVLIVDRMLPGLDGMSVIKALRAMENHTPAIILSALGDVDHRVEGLRAGANDYLIKPFAFSELLARVEILGARNVHSVQPSNTIQVADLCLDKMTRVVKRGSRELDLLPREFALLLYLLENTERVVTRTMLLEHVWSLNFDPKTNIVDVHISRLRQKLHQGNEPPLIHTVRGAGYVLKA